MYLQNAFSALYAEEAVPPWKGNWLIFEFLNIGIDWYLNFWILELNWLMWISETLLGNYSVLTEQVWRCVSWLLTLFDYISLLYVLLVCLKTKNLLSKRYFCLLSFLGWLKWIYKLSSRSISSKHSNALTNKCKTDTSCIRYVLGVLFSSRYTLFLLTELPRLVAMNT